MNRYWNIFLALLLGGSVVACQSTQKEKGGEPDSIQINQPGPTGAEEAFPYQLTQPTQQYDLPKELIEVSAVSRALNGELGMVQDEKGILYLFSEATRSVEGEITFAGNGDFEGLSIVGEDAYALSSNGTIYQINQFREGQSEAIMYRTFLTRDDDTEGLTHDPETNSLLVTCKEAPILAGDRRSDKRVIYRFDLTDHQLDQQPFILLDMHEVKEIFLQQARTPKAREKAAAFEPNKKGSFKPADLAIHPLTGDFYMVAANGQMLVVFSRNAKVRYVQHLPGKIFSQPEGICFGPEGDLYISNEGDDDPGNILRFSYQP